MGAIEVVLLYRPSGFDGEGEFRLAKTVDRTIVRAVAEVAISEARRSAEMWHDLDPALEAATRAQADRLERLLDLIVPNDAPSLRLVPNETPEDPEVPR